MVDTATVGTRLGSICFTSLNKRHQSTKPKDDYGDDGDDYDDGGDDYDDDYGYSEDDYSY